MRWIRAATVAGNGLIGLLPLLVVLHETTRLGPTFGVVTPFWGNLIFAIAVYFRYAWARPFGWVFFPITFLYSAPFLLGVVNVPSLIIFSINLFSLGVVLFKPNDLELKRTDSATSKVFAVFFALALPTPLRCCYSF